MQYINGAPQFDPRALLDQHRTLEAIWNKLRILLRSNGTPITVFYIKGEKQKIVNGVPVLAQPCYCALDKDGKPLANPDRDHHLCYGTGVLPGWDRYGYYSGVVSTTSPGLVVTNTRKTIDEKGRISKFVLNDGSMSGTIMTPDYPLTNFKDFTHWRFVEVVDLESNRNEYELSTDSGTTWIPIPVNYTNKLSPVVDMSVFPQPGSTATTLRFRITQRRRLTTSSSPVFVYIKFRYRTQFPLGEFDDGFKEVTVPATLASYSNNPFNLQQGNSGVFIGQEPSWWCLPEAKIANGDVIMYLLGHRQGKMYFCSDVEERLYGKYSSPTSLSFKTKYVLDEKSDMGIVKFLAEDNELMNYPLFYHRDINDYYPTEADWSTLHYKTNLPSGGRGTV